MGNTNISDVTPAQQLKTLQWVPCAECGGEKIVEGQGYHDVAGYYQVPFEPCPQCQDDTGTATGLQFPGLSEVCPCLDWEADEERTWCSRCYRAHGHQSNCLLCQGRNRIPRRRDVLEAVISSMARIDLSDKEMKEWGDGLVKDIILRGEKGVDACIERLYQAAVAKGLVTDPS